MGMRDAVEIRNYRKPNPPCVCNLLFITRYMRPEGPRQRLAAAHRTTAAFLNINHILAQIRITDHKVVWCPLLLPPQTA